MGIVSSIIAIVLGLVMIIKPASVSASLMLVLGVLLIAVSAIHIVAYVQKRANLATLALSILGVLLGLTMVIWEHTLLKYLFLLCGTVLLVIGIVQLVRVIRYDRRVGASKDLFIYPGLVIACGIVLFFFPHAAPNVLMVLLGISLLLFGLSELMTWLRVQR